MIDVAAKYAHPEVLAFWQQFGRKGLQVAEARMIQLYAPSPARVLDLGCGSGRAGLALVPRGYRVHGLDITWEMVCAARAAYTGAGLVPDLLQADARALPLQAGSYDVVVVLIAALQHIAGRPVRQNAFAEIARVLRPDGRLILALDNVAPALYCYLWWGWRRLRKGPTNVSKAQSTAAPADAALTENRGQMSGLSWHVRGLLRTLRWRTWTGIVDALQRAGLLPGEPGDTHIKQVSLRPTPGDVYYHIYDHEELIADAAAGGLELLGYHSGRELAEGRAFGLRARQLDKQLFYAFERAREIRRIV